MAHVFKSLEKKQYKTKVKIPAMMPVFFIFRVTCFSIK